MRPWLTVLTIFSFCFSRGFAEEQYSFYPQGLFTFLNGIVSDFTFSHGRIYHHNTGQQTILKNLDEWTRAYSWEITPGLSYTCYSPLLSSGSLFDRLKEYDIYDANNEKIGSIETACGWDFSIAARFLFYTASRELLAIAVLERPVIESYFTPYSSHSTFTITRPNGQLLITANKTLQVSLTELTDQYSWKIHQTEPNLPFHESFLWHTLAIISEIWWR